MHVPTRDSLVDLTNLRFGIAAARFGGLTAQDVINAWPLDRLEGFLRKGRSRQELPSSRNGFIWPVA